MNVFFYHQPSALDGILQAASFHYETNRTHFELHSIRPPEIKDMSKVKTVDRWPLWAVDSNSCVLGSTNGLGYRIEGVLVYMDDLLMEHARKYVSRINGYSQSIEVHVCAPNKGIVKAYSFGRKTIARDITNKILLRRSPDNKELPRPIEPPFQPPVQLGATWADPLDDDDEITESMEQLIRNYDSVSPPVIPMQDWTDTPVWANHTREI